MSRHIRTVHKNIKSIVDEAIHNAPIIDLRQHIECVHCNQYFTDTIEMYVHLKEHEYNTHEKENGFNLYCDDCELDHSTFEAYAEHMSNVHQMLDRRTIKPIKCRWCGERYRNVQGLHSHIRSSHRCVDGTVRTSAMIKRNGNAVLASESCLCTDCGRVMSSPMALVAHLKTHRDERSHKCHICNATFK